MWCTSCPLPTSCQCYFLLTKAVYTRDILLPLETNMQIFVPIISASSQTPLIQSKGDDKHLRIFYYVLIFRSVRYFVKTVTKTVMLSVSPVVQPHPRCPWCFRRFESFDFFRPFSTFCCIAAWSSEEKKIKTQLQSPRIVRDSPWEAERTECSTLSCLLLSLLRRVCLCSVWIQNW